MAERPARRRAREQNVGERLETPALPPAVRAEPQSCPITHVARRQPPRRRRNHRARFGPRTVRMPAAYRTRAEARRARSAASRRFRRPARGGENHRARGSVTRVRADGRGQDHARSPAGPEREGRGMNGRSGFHPAVAPRRCFGPRRDFLRPLQMKKNVRARPRSSSRASTRGVTTGRPLIDRT